MQHLLQLYHRFQTLNFKKHRQYTKVYNGENNLNLYQTNVQPKLEPQINFDAELSQEVAADLDQKYNSDPQTQFQKNVNQIRIKVMYNRTSSLKLI